MSSMPAKNPTRLSTAKYHRKAHHKFLSTRLPILPEEFRSSLKQTDFLVIIPAFITSQLKAAFEIGVVIYLPFFVIDLVTSNILLAMV